MLVIRAHSFILQARLAISLALVAGYTNVVAILTCGVVVSHMTGHAANLGREVVEGKFAAAALLATILVAFFVGAFISGLATEAGRLRGWSSIYVLPAAIEIALLCAFAVGVELHNPIAEEFGNRLWWMTIVAAVSMGLQNATITRISSGVVRTTHLTGILTDLGHESAQLALVRQLLGGRGAARNTQIAQGPGKQRLLLLASILFSFIVGSALGALAYASFPHWSMVPPIALLAWVIVEDVRKPICELAETMLAETMLAEFGDAGLPGDICIVKAIPRGGDGATEARLPNLAEWLAQLDPHKRRVVLDLSAARSFGPLAAIAIDALVAACARSGRQLIVAGLSPSQRRTINSHSRADLLHDGNATADVAAALARMRERPTRAISAPTAPGST